MTSHCRAALAAAGLPALVLPSTPETPVRLSDALTRDWAVPDTCRRCAVCREIKPLSEFHRLRDGHQSYCRSCRAADSRLRRSAPKPVAPSRQSARGRNRDVRTIRYLHANTQISTKALAARFRTDLATIERVLAGENPWQQTQEAA